MEKKITLRKFADMVKISPTYISQIERDEFKPPIDDKIREIAMNYLVPFNYETH